MSESQSAISGDESRQKSSSKQNIALTLLWRNWKSGELNILVFSLLLAIATVTSISLFTNRIHNSIYQEASQFIAGDARVSGSLPIPKIWQDEAHLRALNTAKVLNFRAMAFSEDEMTLTQVKAVSSAYPLKGNLAISDQPYTSSDIVTQGPRPGEAWIAPRLFDALNVSTGQAVTIGQAEFIVKASINKEPDSGQSLFGVAPRIMIHIDDVERTGAVQVGSRVGYSMLLSDESDTDADIESYKEWLEPRLENHHRWTGVKDGNRGVGSALDRAERFLLLAGCLSVVLSGVALALAARRYAKRQQNQVALLKTFGKTPNQITRLYGINLLAIGTIGLIAGTALGVILHGGIFALLGNLMPEDLAPASASAYWIGSITGIISLWAFAAPPLFSLRNVSPASILRDDNKALLHAGWSMAIGLASIVLLVLLYSRDLKITAIISVGALACILGVGVLSNALINLTKRFGHRLGKSWNLGFANLKRHKQFNALQIVIFAILFLLLFVLITVRTSLIGQWQNQLPDNAPNHFVFNIFPEETDSIRDFFAQRSIEHSPFYPMIRGRVINVDEEATKTLAQNANNRMNYERELNLTWSSTFGEDNSIVAGEWWSENDPDEALLVSVEAEYASGLAIDLGDVIEFSVAGATVHAKVTSLRSVHWDSMNPNFFMIFNKPIANGVGANWLTSFFIPPEQKSFINDISRAYPTISVIELDQTLKQIQDIIAKVSLAIEFILLLVLCSGILVLITSIQATLDVRLKESAILRTLGGSRQLVRKTLLIEFCSLGVLAGILGALGMELCMFFLQTRVFDLSYEPQPIIWVLGPAFSALLIGSIGWLSTRKVINVPPLTILRADL